MAKAKGENTKKAAGNAKKVAVAQTKADVHAAQQSKLEDEEWGKGAKSGAKKEDAAAKKAAAAAKKAERDALLAQEAAELPDKPRARNSVPRKGGSGPSKGIDNALNGSSGDTISATGLDNALDALSLTKAANTKELERHPEKRFKAAIAAYEERRIPEIRQEHPGLRLNQMKEMMRKEFEKSPENPFNQLTLAHDATKQEANERLDSHRRNIESRLRS